MTLQTSPTHPLFFLSRPRPSDTRVGEFIAGLQEQDESVDYDQLLELAERNGTSGFLYNSVKKLSVIPEQVRRQLQTTYRNTTYRNLHQVAENIKLLKLFAANQVRVLPLKGVVASEMIFHDLGVYPSGDIDVLIHPDDLDTATEVLQNQAGYAPVAGHDQEELLAGHYHYMFHNDRYLLEVHWNLTKRYFEVEPDYWWQDVRSVVWRGENILELAPEKYLMYAIFRLFDHCFFPLRFLVLVAGIIEQYGPDICWDTLMHDCRRYQMERLALFTLKLAHDLLGCEIPANIAKRKVFACSLLKKLCLSGMLNGVERKHLRMMAYMLLLDSPAAVLKALLGRLTPGREELCLRYNLNSGSPEMYLYYLLNPVLLFLKSKEK
jgi:hypothetical protein